MNFALACLWLSVKICLHTHRICAQTPMTVSGHYPVPLNNRQRAHAVLHACNSDVLSAYMPAFNPFTPNLHAKIPNELNIFVTNVRNHHNLLPAKPRFIFPYPSRAVVFRHLSFSPHPAMNPKRVRQCATGSSVVTIRAVSVSAQHASVFNDRLASAASPLHSDICKDLADSSPPSHLFVQNRMEEMAEHQHH